MLLDIDILCPGVLTSFVQQVISSYWLWTAIWYYEQLHTKNLRLSQRTLQENILMSQVKSVVLMIKNSQASSGLTKHCILLSFSTSVGSSTDLGQNWSFFDWVILESLLIRLEPGYVNRDVGWKRLLPLVDRMGRCYLVVSICQKSIRFVF